MINLKFIIGGFDLEPEPIESVKQVLASFFAGFTYTIGEGGWHSDGAPYAGGGKDPDAYMVEPAHVFEVVCRADFDLYEVKKKLSEVLHGHAEHIMVVSYVVSNTHNFRVSDYIRAIEYGK